MTKLALLTIQNSVEHLLKEKGSRFICRAEPAADETTAESAVQTARQKYPDATHHCYAYCVGSGPRKIFRFNDDGEPSGTAGRPILQAITGRDLSRVVVVVVRYFGGTKLGTGGLIRAYGGVAAQTLDKAHMITVYPTHRFALQFAYPLSQAVDSAIHKFQALVVDSSFGAGVRFVVSVRNDRAVDFCDHLRDLTANNVEITDMGEIN